MVLIKNDGHIGFIWDKQKLGWLSSSIFCLWGTKAMYCYVVKWPVFSLHRGSAKSPIAPFNFSSLCPNQFLNCSGGPDWCRRCAVLAARRQLILRWAKPDDQTTVSNWSLISAAAATRRGGLARRQGRKTQIGCIFKAVFLTIPTLHNLESYNRGATTTAAAAARYMKSENLQKEKEEKKFRMGWCWVHYGRGCTCTCIFHARMRFQLSADRPRHSIWLSAADAAIAMVA